MTVRADAPVVVPIVEEGLGNASYLIDAGDGRALVVDPGRDPRPYAAEAGRRGLRVAWTAETHVHADFVSGGTGLAALGATVIAARAAGLGFAHHGMVDGDRVALGGRLTLEAVATPGHTPAHLAYLLSDGARPVGVFSGGALIVGGAARTDLAGAADTEVWARAAYRSIRHRLLALPDNVTLYPTHGPGSFCSTGSGGERTSTIGAERAANPLLAGDADEDTFVARLLASLGTYPAYFDRLPALNRAGPAVLDPWPELRALDVVELRAALAGGAQLVDVRTVEEFAAGYVPGSVSIELRPQFQTWLGWMIDPDVPLLFVIGEGQDRVELVRQCVNVGYSTLSGELTGGVDTWVAGGGELAVLPLVQPSAIGTGHAVLDVRQRSEWNDGHLPDAVHTELGGLPGAEVAAGPLTVMCGHGQRAMTAASLLSRAGHRQLTVLAGGVDDWAAATGGPVERSQ